MKSAAIVTALGALVICLSAPAHATPEVSAKAEALMEKAARQKDEKQVQTYIEACDVGAAAACTKAAQLGRNIANQKYILNAPEIAVLLEKGCREGGEAECLAAAGAAELKARWTLGDDFQPEQASPDTGYEMAVLGCERGWAQLCFTAADQLSAGITLPPNFDAAATYYDTACRLGQTKACERAELFNGTDADAFAATKERANLIWQSKSYLMAIDLPDDHPARVIARKQYSAKTTREKTQYQLDACNAGDPKSCFELGFALEQQISYSDAPAGVNKRELLMKACALGSSQGCQSAARLTKYAPLRYAYYDNSRDLYERACLKMANPVACDEWGEWIEAEGDIDADAQLVRSLYRKSCLFRNKMDTCEKLDAFEQKMTPERVAARMATKQALAARKRVVPFAAYDICAGPESAALGRAVDAGNGAAAFTDFVKRCGGEYARPQLKAACERLPDAPSHHKLLCSAVLMEFKADESITAGSWSVSGTQLSETFRVWPSETYLDRSNMGHIANALNPDAPLQTAYSGPVGASLFPEIEGLAEVRTAVGQNAFRLVLQDRGFVILSPVDPVNTTFRNGVYSVYVFKEGATPEGYTAGEGEFPDQIGAARMEHRAAWDEAAGKWQVETASFFEIPWGDDWQDIAQGRLYAFLAHGKETSGANGLCCGSSLFIPFEGDTLTAHALQRTTMASLYGGTITPDVAQAMRIALNDSPETPLWSSRCGERPYVSTGGMGFEDFDNMVDDYSLRREKNALKRRIAWYDCQQDAFNNQLAEVNAFLAEYRAKPPTDPMRWRAALMLSRFEAHRGKLESEADTLDSYSATIGKATSQYNAEQRALRRAARAERQATQSGNSAADDFYYRNSGAYYSACLSNAQSYGQQQGCMDQWLANTDSARAQRDAAGESHGSESAEGDSGFYDVVEPVLTYEKIPSAEVPEAPVSTYQPPEPEPLPPPKKPLCPEGYNCNCGPTPIPKSEIQASCR